MRIALVGCGRISRNHLDAITHIDGLHLAAVCDVVAERAREAGERHAVPWFTSYDAMLAEAACDVVAICTPSGMHPEHGEAAARAGKHVVSEKPMRSRSRGRTPRARLRRRGSLRSSSSANRLNLRRSVLRRAVDRGLRPAVHVKCTVRWAAAEYYEQAPWRGTWALDAARS